MTDQATLWRSKCDLEQGDKNKTVTTKKRGIDARPHCYSTTLLLYVCKEGDIVFCLNDPFCQSKPLYGCLFRFILRIKCVFSVRILVLICILFKKKKEKRIFHFIFQYFCCFSCERREIYLKSRIVKIINTKAHGLKCMAFRACPNPFFASLTTEKNV